MEESISLVELDWMLKAIRQDQEDTRVFQAALKGIDLKKNGVDHIEEKKREIVRRVAEKQLGYAEVERQEFGAFGFDFET